MGLGYLGDNKRQTDEAENSGTIIKDMKIELNESDTNIKITKAELTLHRQKQQFLPDLSKSNSKSKFWKLKHQKITRENNNKMNEEVDTPNLKYTKELVSMRRAKVLELSAQGLTQVEIGRQLSVSQAVVSLDKQYLRETAQTKIKTHIEERIPTQFEEC